MSWLPKISPQFVEKLVWIGKAVFAMGQRKEDMLSATLLISSDSHVSLGENINGPWLSKVPDWVSDPSGRYYLNFAYHQGKSIRLSS